MKELNIQEIRSIPYFQFFRKINGLWEYQKSEITRERVRTNQSLQEKHCVKCQEVEWITNIVKSLNLASMIKGNLRLARLLGMLGKQNQRMVNIPSCDRSNFSQEKYKFMLFAPFEVSNKCCNVMKKMPVHHYDKVNHCVGITAQMAIESRLRTQQWLKNGCNGFEMKQPISNPMSFWTEQDVLLYCKLYNIPLAPVYGDIIVEGDENMEKDYDWDKIAELEKFELDRPFLKTTGCSRSGCVMCGFGLHLDKRPNRLELIDKLSNPKLRDYCLRGGAFDKKDGLWRPHNGLGMWFVYLWINYAGGFDIYIPEVDRYRKEYGNDVTEYYLEQAKEIREMILEEKKQRKLYGKQMEE